METTSGDAMRKYRGTIRDCVATLSAAILCLAGSSFDNSSRGAEPGGSFDQTVTPFLAANCLKCHNDKREFSDLDLKVYDNEASLAKDRKVWLEVVRRIKSGEMPPKEEPRPNADDIQIVTT